MRIAEFRESSDSWTQLALGGSPPSMSVSVQLHWELCSTNPDVLFLRTTTITLESTRRVFPSTTVLNSNHSNSSMREKIFSMAIHFKSFTEKDTVWSTLLKSAEKLLRITSWLLSPSLLCFLSPFSIEESNKMKMRPGMTITITIWTITVTTIVSNKNRSSWEMRTRYKCWINGFTRNFLWLWNNALSIYLQHSEIWSQW